MADTEDEVLVKIDDETGDSGTQQRDAQGRFVAVETDDGKKVDPAVAELQAQFETLRANEERERDARQRAERVAADERRAAEAARKDAETARSEVTDSQLGHVTSGIAAAEAEASAAEAEYAKLLEEGKFAEAAKAQRKMARAEAEMVRLNEAKADIESRKETQKSAPREDVRKTDTSPASGGGDQFETYLSQFTQPTAKWLRDHRDWVEDTKKNAKLMAGHHDALAEGLKADSPEYFAHVETFIGLKQQTNGKGNGAARPAPQRRSGAPVAPVNGGHSGGSSVMSNEVRLSRSEALAATDGTHVWNYDDPSPQKRFKKGDVIGVQEFARRKLAMQKQGLYDKSFTES